MPTEESLQHDPGHGKLENRAPRGPAEIPEALLDPDAVKVVRRLRRAGYLAYLVGGCVRDLLLGMRPKDFDVATSAHPNQVKETFRNCRLIGRRFRLAHVFFRGGKIIEVSTFRANPLDELTDLPADLLIRHDNVFGNAEEDARRRDFTINGLFYDLDEGKVVDYVKGKVDLEARLVRTIGVPDVRLREDPVRILRAIRFAAKCALQLERETLAAMKAHAPEIPRCAPPRVLEEMLKLVRSGAARRCFELLREVGALRVLLPPVAEYLEQRGPTEAERHLRALDALDAHVKVGEIPSDAVLLATLLAPLPRGGAPRGPIPKAPPREPLPGVAGAEPAPDGEQADERDDELDEELQALNRVLEDASSDSPDAEGDDAASAGEGDESGDAEEPGDAEAGDGDDAGDADGDEGEGEETAGDLAASAREAIAAPLPEGALRNPGELHDERLGAPAIPTFSIGRGAQQPWSLPRDVVAPEIVLAEMVRTARLPRRIAERARLILAAQPILAGERKRRKFSAASFARQSIFPEALAVFELSVAAAGRGAEQLARWQAIFAGQPISELEVEEKPPRREGGPGPRRRRRGGRGRGRKGKGS
jgi:Poly A polymerase head domain/Probable RNA and SrmB- binding site of polymerase A/Polymerase A arginine-rich C-terminus